MRDGFLYIMASVTRTLYIGVTNGLVRRVWQHQHGEIAGFTKRYELNRLVYFEHYGDIRDAIAREKQLKRWRRSKKNALIKSVNPNWNDLSPMLEQEPRLLTRHPERCEAESKDRERGEHPDTRSLDKLGMTEAFAAAEV